MHRARPRAQRRPRAPAPPSPRRSDLGAASTRWAETSACYGGPSWAQPYLLPSAISRASTVRRRSHPRVRSRTVRAVRRVVRPSGFGILQSRETIGPRSPVCERWWRTRALRPPASCDNYPGTGGYFVRVDEPIPLPGERQQLCSRLRYRQTEVGRLPRIARCPSRERLGAREAIERHALVTAICVMLTPVVDGSTLRRRTACLRSSSYAITPNTALRKRRSRPRGQRRATSL